MIKIVTLSLALALTASAGFAQSTPADFVKKGPKITLQNKVPPVAVFSLGAAGVAVFAAVLNSSGASTTTTPTTAAN